MNNRRKFVILGGKNVFQCFWSGPKTRVFECFWVSPPPPSPRAFFNVFGIGRQKHCFLYCFSETLYCFCHLGLSQSGGGENFKRKASSTAHSSLSRDTAVAGCCCLLAPGCCCDGADAAATELMLRAARVPPQGAAASLLEVLPAAPREGTRR